MKKLKSADLPQLREQLTSATVEDRGLTTLETVIEVLPHLDSLRARGASFNEIAEVLGRGGLTLRASTLRQYYRRAKESGALSARVRSSSDPAHKGQRETVASGGVARATMASDSASVASRAAAKTRPTRSQEPRPEAPPTARLSSPDPAVPAFEGETGRAAGVAPRQPPDRDALEAPVARPSWMPAAQINVTPDRKNTVG